MALAHRWWLHLTGWTPPRPVAQSWHPGGCCFDGSPYLRLRSPTSPLVPFAFLYRSLDSPHSLAHSRWNCLRPFPRFNATINTLGLFQNKPSVGSRNRGILHCIPRFDIDLYGLYHPKTPASLLRFYWFRWNDVAFPIVIVMLLAHWCLAPIESGWRQNLAWVLLLIPSSLWLADRTLIQWNQVIPEADCRSLLMPNENEGQELKTYQDWMAVCGWIQANTPEDALFITPRYQQSFVWYSQRAEVVNWKNVPQDATSYA